MGPRLGQGRSRWGREYAVGSLAVGLNESHTTLLQLSQAKGYSNLRAE